MRSTTMLPSRSTRPRSPGSMKMVASGCSITAGASITASAGRSSRDHTHASTHAPPKKTWRVPRSALLSDAVASGANAARSKAGRRQMAAVRSETIRIGMPGSMRLNAAE